MKEAIPLPARWIARAFQKYWRLVRGLRLSVEACVIDDSGRILMVREENGGSWELPGGAVRQHEDVGTALRRVLRDISAIEVNAKPELSFMCAHGKDTQAATFTVRRWSKLSTPTSRETGFFSPDSLPPAISVETAGRIRRSLEDRTPPKL